MAEAARKLELIPRPDAVGESSMTLLDLVTAIADQAESDDEILAAVIDLINSGRVKLIGNFRGADVKVG
jgi:hypothetical protein